MEPRREQGVGNVRREGGRIGAGRESGQRGESRSEGKKKEVMGLCGGEKTRGEDPGKREELECGKNHKSIKEEDFQ